MSRRIKNTISTKELLQAMGGIRDCYVKEAVILLGRKDIPVSVPIRITSRLQKS